MSAVAHEEKSLLRFITCGSVDDGKSTLIGRLLYESNLICDDHLAELEADSKRDGTQGSELDLALLVDGSDPNGVLASTGLTKGLGPHLEVYLK